MKSRRAVRPFLLTILAGFLALQPGCRKRGAQVADKPRERPVQVADELNANRLGDFPGSIYRSQAASPIHWQPWTRETLERAKAADRLVFAVVAMPQQPGFLEVLAALEADSGRVAQINASYVPVLIDGDSAREIGLLTADLCAEINRPLQLPLFLWMTYEANPVAWLPVTSASQDAVGSIFEQSHTMVASSWKDSPDYVLKNSRLDNGGRQERIGRRRNTRTASKEPAEDSLRAVRQLASYYDPSSHTFDEAGGLFPAGSIDLLAVAALNPGVPAEIREKALETLNSLLGDILPSPMFDPLEGGVYTARRGSSWAFPSFARDCVSQARAAVALFDASRATGNAAASERALDLIAFAEKTFLTAEGLFAIGLSVQPDPANWVWSVEEIEKDLPPEDAAWWIRATGMKGLGNLPSEADPRREFFRKNTLGMRQTPAEIAAGLHVPVEDFLPRYEATRKRLLKVRNERRGEFPRDDSSHAGSTFRMVSAYVAAYGASGQEIYREKAISLLEKARMAFTKGPRLREFSRDAPAPVGEGRAFLYGLAMQAVLDVAAISPDERWLLWADDLATTSAELFTAADFLKECPDDARLIDLPVTDLVMLFDDSTAGLISSAEGRLAALGRPLVESFSKFATPLPDYVPERPILHTDLVEATIARLFPVVVTSGADVAPELKVAVSRLPARAVRRRMAKPGDDVAAKSVTIQIGDQPPLTVSTAEELRQALLPPPANP